MSEIIEVDGEEFAVHENPPDFSSSQANDEGVQDSMEVEHNE